MSTGEPIPIGSTGTTALDTGSLAGSSSSSVWDRLSTWASENKALVYTIAGVAVVVTGAGVVYYVSDSRKNPQAGAAAEEKKRASKKERRKAKKAETGKPTVSKSPEEPGRFVDLSSTPQLTWCFAEFKKNTATVQSDLSDDLPQVDEAIVEALSEQV